MRTLCLLIPALLAFRDDTDRRIDEFAGKITGSDPTLTAFQKALKTPAGKIVLRDRVEKAAERLRKNAERNSLPDFFRAHFEEADGKYRLRAGEEEWRRRLVDGHKLYLEDIEKITPFIREVGANFAGEPEINARLKKLLTHEASPHFLYKSFRGKSRPDIYTFQKELGIIFVMSEDGKFYIPEGSRETAEKYAKVGGTIVAETERAAGIFKKFAASLAPFDDVHKRLKESAGDPLLAGLLLKNALKPDENDLDGFPAKVKGAVDEIERHLPDVCRDTPKGKVLLEEKLDGVEEIFTKYDEVRKKVAALRDPAREFAARLRDKDGMAETFRKMLHSDVLLSMLDHVGENLADPVTILKAALDKAVIKEDGKYRVSPDKEEDVKREIKDPGQLFRKEDNALKLLTMYGEKVEDPDLRKILTSRYGTLEVELQVKGMLLVKAYDGLGAWVAEHFDTAADGYKLRNGAKAEIESILAQVEKLEKEGKKDDLKD